MATQLRRRRGSTAAHATFTGAQGELTVNTDTNRVHVHDGVTANGHPLAALADLIVDCVDSSSTANAIVIASNSGPVAAVDGMITLISVAETATGACTVEYNLATPVPLLDGLGSAIAAGGIVVGQMILVVYRAAVSSFIILARDGTSEGTGGGGGGGGGGGDFPLGNIGTVPTLSAFTFNNQGSATATQNGGAGTPITLTAPNNSSLNWRSLTKMVPTGATWTAYIWVKLEGFAQNSGTVGVQMFDSATGKALSFELLYQGSVQPLRVERLNSLTSDNTTVFQSPNNFIAGYGGAAVCFKLDRHSGNLNFSHSFDGYDFYPDYTEAVGAFMTPDSVGISALCLQGTGYYARNSLLGWTLTNT